MYSFSEFACSLNEPEEGVAPTDSRLRPDIRIMEQQDFDGANSEKVFATCVLFHSMSCAMTLGQAGREAACKAEKKGSNGCQSS